MSSGEVISGFDPCRAVATLAQCDLACCDADGVEQVLAQARGVEGWLEGVKLAAARRLEGLRAAGAAPRPDVVLGELWGRKDAGRMQRRAEIVAEAPAIEAALDAGTITAAHVDAVATAVKATPAVAEHHEALAVAAAAMGPDRFGEHCRRLAFLLADDGGIDHLERQRAATRVRRWVDHVTGLYHLTGAFDPERGAQLWTAIDAAVERRFHLGSSTGMDNDQRAAVALHALTTSRGDRHRAGDRRGRGSGDVQPGDVPPGREDWCPPEMAVTMHVHVDLDTLVSGLHARSVVGVPGGGDLPVAAIRRMACDAEIVPVVLDGHGVVVDVGRSRRLATGRQRQALRAMYPTCAIPGCAVRFEHTTIHHLVPWEQGGATDLGNLLPMCSRHHHDAHEGGWRYVLDPVTRELTVHRPDGAHHSTTPLRSDARPPPGRDAA